MDAFNDIDTRTVVVMSSAQIGKTEVLLNVIGFHIHHDPAPILLVQPTLEIAGAFSKDRMAPMLRDTPSLANVMGDPRGLSSDQTILHKGFPGGHVTMSGANSPSSLSSRPIRIVLCDEVDRYPPSVGAEGDPVSLAAKRAITFWNRKLGLTSTPTDVSTSRIAAAYKESDQRRFWVPCPDCEETQVLAWKQIKYKDDNPKTARYCCEHCGVLWDDAQRITAVEEGEWRVGRDKAGKSLKFDGTAGFHIWSAYASWVRMEDIVREYLEAVRSRSMDRMRAWTNTVLGITFEDAGDHPDEGSLMARPRTKGISPQVLAKTCGVDVQDNRLEVELVGWGKDHESWSLDYTIIKGDPSKPSLWAELDEYLLHHRPAATCVDSGGHFTEQVYRFCRNRWSRRVYAIKGSSSSGGPVWPRKVSRPRIGNTGTTGLLYIVNVMAAKDSIFAWLKLTTTGPGYCHMPTGRDDAWFLGLTSEAVITKYSKGFPVREYVARPNLPNEPLDCRVYAYAALCSFGKLNWLVLEARRKRNTKPVEGGQYEVVGQQPTQDDPEGTHLSDQIQTEAAPSNAAQQPSNAAQQPSKAPQKQAIRRGSGNWVTGGRDWKQRPGRW